MTTMKILEGTTDAANQSYYAAEGLKALGYDARCAHYTSCEYFLEGDFEFGFDRAKRVRYPLYALSLIHISSYRIAYSVKTNYLPFFCGVVKECAGMAEVVSGMEYDLVRRMGFSPSDIVFNGPYKGDALEKSLTEGACVIVDNAVEARAVADIARKHAGRALRVGLRLNYDVGNGKVSRFGFDVSSDELRGTVSLLSSLPNVLVEGIHCHFTGARSLDRWELRARTMIDLSLIHISSGR